MPNQHIRVETTGPDEFHCFRLVMGAKPDPLAVDRREIEIMLHATDLVDLIHKASIALCEWQHEGTQYLLQKLAEAREAV